MLGALPRAAKSQGGEDVLEHVSAGLNREGFPCLA